MGADSIYNRNRMRNRSRSIIKCNATSLYIQLFSVIERHNKEFTCKLLLRSRRLWNYEHKMCFSIREYLTLTRINKPQQIAALLQCQSQQRHHTAQYLAPVWQQCNVTTNMPLMGNFITGPLLTMSICILNERHTVSLWRKYLWGRKSWKG